MYKFYLQEGDLNEATSYYVNIVRESLCQLGETVIFVSSLNQINPHDKVFVIHAKAFLKVWMKNPKQYIVIWFQGVVPEEAMCMFENSFSKYPRKYFWTFLEWLALRNAKKVFFVSQAMLEHYRIKYRYCKNNYFIMPCFNQELNLSAFGSQRYKSPSFVYVGSLSRWQCITETLQLFSKIKKILPQATLSVYTKDREQAARLCEQNKVDAKIDYVSIENLQEVLTHYKYGFIVREDITVNNVATPTKMNSYMAAGVIPVYSDVIYDFRTVLGALKYAVPFREYNECICKIEEIERQKINIELIKEEYKRAFDTYYSAKKYSDKLRQFLPVDD